MLYVCVQIFNVTENLETFLELNKTLLHRIFGHMYRVLNIDEKITNYTICKYFMRQIFWA